MSAGTGITDIHTHLLPGVDDGAKNFEESIRLIQLEAAEGVQNIILTPHYRKGMFETPQAVIKKNFDELAGRIREMPLEVRLYPGCECHAYTSLVDDLAGGRLPTLAGSSYVLTEFSDSERYSFIKWEIGELLSAGFRPIIAHAERIGVFLDDFNKLYFIQEAGAEIQITAAALAGEISWGSKRFTQKMIREGLVQYVASDTHDGLHRRPFLEKARLMLTKKFDAETAEELMIKNPMSILSDD